VVIGYELWKVMISATMIDAETRRAADLFMRRIADRYDAIGGILFGSRARRTHRPESDADVAVLLRGVRQRFMPAMRDMDDVAFDVLLETGVGVQPLPIWEDEWARPEQSSTPRLLANIAREGIDL
jgi:predicted nucleotidyltransferase